MEWKEWAGDGKQDGGMIETFGQKRGFLSGGQGQPRQTSFNFR
jgi:hypothetical protein